MLNGGAVLYGHPGALWCLFEGHSLAGLITGARGAVHVYRIMLTAGYISYRTIYALFAAFFTAEAAHIFSKFVNFLCFLSITCMIIAEYFSLSRSFYGILTPVLVFTPDFNSLILLIVWYLHPKFTICCIFMLLILQDYILAWDMLY